MESRHQAYKIGRMARHLQRTLDMYQTYLSEVEELALVEWCFSMQKVALCVTLNMLKCTIQTILKNAPRHHPFRDGIPGKKWWDGFKKRHPSFTLRCADGLEMKRALGLNRESTTFFLTYLSTYILHMDFYPATYGTQMRLE